MSQKVHAQLIVADTLANDTLFKTLFGQGVTVSNLTFQFCQPSQTGQFNGVNTNLGLDSGVVVSTGNIFTAPGPNVSGNTTAGFTSGPVNYPPLSNIAGFNVFDACVIEFDITPLCDTIGISYVFASEEYNEFVASNFNDAFAFFISGPGFGPPPGQNIALIPGTTTPVTINNVNNGNSPTGFIPAGPCTNCAYYQDNTFGTTIEFDGFTVPMVASAQVTPCMTYHITLAIADVSDPSYDSGVFFEIGGIGCVSPTLQLSAVNSTVLGSNVAVEGCVNNGLFTFTLPQPLPDTTVFYFTIGGTATPGVDYQPFQDSIVMPAGVVSLTLPVYIYSDSLLEGSEYIEIYYVDSTLCTNQIYRDTAVMEIWDRPPIPPLEDKAFCSEEVVSIGFTPQASQTYTWLTAFGLSNPAISNPDLSLTNNSPDSMNLFYFLETTAFQGYCIDLDTMLVTVYPGNFADFVIDTVCEGYMTTFTPSTVFDSLVNFAWDFGDNNGSTFPVPTHTYSTQGTYSVELITINSKGCKDTIVHTALVDSLPSLNFSVNPVCQNSNSIFLNGIKPGTSYQWAFGDGNTSTSANPVHLYDTFGVYTVQLIGITAQGCVDSISGSAEVYQNPVAAFDTEFECFGVPLQFNNTSRNGSGINLTYQWNYGDNGTSTQISPSHLYGNFGVYSVALRVDDENGCTDTHSEPVRVYALPEADFNVEAVCALDEVIFNDLSTIADNSKITKYLWRFHDQRVSGINLPKKTFEEPGIYSEFLRVETEFGCADSITKDLTIYPLPFTYFQRKPVCVFDSTFFENQSYVVDSITGDVIARWIWEFGDGFTNETDLNPGHAYQEPGLYSVRLTNFTDKGCESTRRFDLDIYPLPDPALVVEDTTCFSDQATLIAQPAAGTKRVEWFYDPGDAKPFHTGSSYTTPPLPYDHTYYVRSISSQNCIGNFEPVIAHLYHEGFGQLVPSQMVVEMPDATVNFRVEGTILAEAYRWNFGDGTVSDEANPMHSYQYPGKYEVLVDLVDQYGCEYRLSELVEVKQLITVFVPSAFSPNGDGFNDRLTLGHNLINAIDFQVFNRWGQRVFSSNSLDLEWDGRDEQNVPVQEGVYVYQLRGQDFRGELVIESGTITVIR
ncbi:MAG: choice-of-anchor L domain-containing protein [Bacteroidetes bacterium]|nr:choice-of-anchor L domain-containing protein [Bacteroidota bacterium]